VVDKDPSANTVTVGGKDALLSRGLVASDTNWLIDRLPTAASPRRCGVKIRYNSQPTPAAVWATDQGLEVRFDEPLPAVTPGQAVVCYDGEQVIGGGWIDRPVR